MKAATIVAFLAGAGFLATAAAGQVAGGAPALGGRFASQGMARPLGGISAGASRGFGSHGFGGARAYGPRYAAPPAVPYAYSWYVPNYFDWDSLDTSPYGYAPPYAGEAGAIAAPAPAAPQQPVIINQFFGPPPQQQAPTQPASGPDSGPANSDSAYVKPGDPIGPVDNYYLIAYKNHQIYSALAYWVEGNTLHYVTTENTHNQASLSLIDLDLTKTLNQARDIPFSLQPVQSR